MNQDSLIPKATASSIFHALGICALIIAGLMFLEGILKPIIIAFFATFILSQIKLLIQKIKIRGKQIPSGLSSILALLLISALIVAISEILMVNIEGITKQLPGDIDNLRAKISNSNAVLLDAKYSRHIQDWVFGLNYTEIIRSLLSSFSNVIATSAIVVVYVIFFLLEGSRHKLKIEKLFPGKGKKYNRFQANISSIANSIRSYIWSKTLISLFTGGISFVILLIMNVDYAFLWSFLIFVFNFIPYIGPLISSLLPAIFAMLTKADVMQLLYVFAAMEGVQIVLGNFIEPKIMGKGSNMGPVAVIVALAFWGMVWDITGMLLAVPITSLIVIIASQYSSTRFIAVLLSEKGDIEEFKD